MKIFVASFLPYLLVGDACLKTETDFLDAVTHPSIPKKKVVVSRLGFVMTPKLMCLETPTLDHVGQLIAVIRHIHSVGFVTRDIRPANVMVSLDGTRVFLTDFGYATKVGEMKKYEGALSTASNRILVLKRDHPDDSIGVTIADELESVVKVPFI